MRPDTGRRVLTAHGSQSWIQRYDENRDTWFQKAHDVALQLRRAKEFKLRYNGPLKTNVPRRQLALVISRVTDCNTECLDEIEPMLSAKGAQIY
jgi:hypothetical protein